MPTDRRAEGPVPPAPAVSGRASAAPLPEPPDDATLELWRAILGTVASRRPGVASVYEHGALLALGAGRMVVAYAPGSFLAQQAADAAALAVLQEAANERLGAPVVVEIDTSGRHVGIVTLAALNSAERAARLAAARAQVANRPLVQEAVRLLGAQLREIRLPESGH